MIKPLRLKKNDLQPYYYGKVANADGSSPDLTGAEIYCTMKKAGGATPKIDRQTTGVIITDGLKAEFEYRWQAGDTDTPGKYSIEFEIDPPAGGKFTIPVRQDAAIVLITESEDDQ
jgi:hypothetical protein